MGEGGRKMDTFDLDVTHPAEEERETTTVSRITEYRGLCSTCKNALTCTYPRDPRRPVFHCCEHEGYEECEGSVSLALVSAGRIFPGPPDVEAKFPAAVRDSEKIRGLCVNCANRATCTFPKPEGGVWHCDEYR